jgi:hypothetical protein
MVEILAANVLEIQSVLLENGSLACSAPDQRGDLFESPQQQPRDRGIL